MEENKNPYLSSRFPAFLEKQNRQETKAEDRTSGQPASDAEERLAEFLKELESLQLKELSLQEITRLYWILSHARSGSIPEPVRYNLLIECEEDESGTKAASAIAEGLRRAGFFEEEALVTSEKAAPVLPASDAGSTQANTIPGMLKPQPRGNRFANSLPDRFDIGNRPRVLIIRKCQEAPRPDPILSTNAADKRELAIKEYREFWNKIENTQKALPGSLLIAVVPSSVLHSSWKMQDHLYYRIFPGHIRLRRLGPAEIYDRTLLKLYELDYDPTEAFLTGLKDYIDTVYPKADLRRDAFTEDLINRIQTCYFSVAEPEKGQKLTERCIPYYHRAETVEQVSGPL